MKVTKQIDIYLIQKRNVRVIDVVQYDTGIQLVFVVDDLHMLGGNKLHTVFLCPVHAPFEHQR